MNLRQKNKKKGPKKTNTEKCRADSAKHSVVTVAHKQAHGRLKTAINLRRGDGVLQRGSMGGEKNPQKTNLGVESAADLLRRGNGVHLNLFRERRRNAAALFEQGCRAMLL